MSTIYDFDVTTITGDTYSMAKYRGDVLLIVNTASKWGFTPQLGELQSLHEKYADKGLRVLAFPCNQFGSQEPGTNPEVLEFAQQNYGVTFQMHAKIEVNGKGADPLYQHLKTEARGILGSKAIKWNFTKFVVDREGKVLTRHAPNVKPSDLVTELEGLLG